MLVLMLGDNQKSELYFFKVFFLGGGRARKMFGKFITLQGDG